MSNVLRLFSTANEFHFHFLLAKPQIEEEVEKDNMLKGLDVWKSMSEQCYITYYQDMNTHM